MHDIFSVYSPTFIAIWCLVLVRFGGRIAFSFLPPLHHTENIVDSIWRGGLTLATIVDMCWVGGGGHLFCHERSDGTISFDHGPSGGNANRRDRS